MDSWLPLILLSAVALGVYQVFCKGAVRDNDVLGVLLFASLSGAATFLLIHLFAGDLAAAATASARVRLLVGAKVLLVGASWVCGYLALRTMPITLVTPIRATAPFWTLLGAMALYGEVPRPLRAVGMAVMLAGFFLTADAGKREGFPVLSRGMAFLVAGTLLGSASALYDKYLLNRVGIAPSVVQFHFSMGLAVLYAALWLARRALGGERPAFTWRWSIVATGAMLIVADALYFHAVSVPETPISVLSLLRRCSAVVTFVLGALFFHDGLLRRKALALAIVLAGAVLVALG